MRMSIPVILISVVLFFVIFFVVGFLLNMLFRSSWVMVVIFPITAIMIVNDAKLIEYFRSPEKTFSGLGTRFVSLQAADLIILFSGLAGAILAGVIIKLLRKQGYQMF